MPRSRSLSELIEQNRAATMMANAGVSSDMALAASQAATASLPAQGGGVGAKLGQDAAGQALKAGLASSAAGEGFGAGAMAGLEGSALGEGIAGLLAMFCWVAAEYYPRNSGDWLRCRNWVLSHPLLTKVYITHGPWLAAQIRLRRWLRVLVRPLVLWARWRGQP